MQTFKATDIPGQAIYDYHVRKGKLKLYIHNLYGKKEEMLVSTYFRQWHQMPLLEQKALMLCKGNVLDIGAGAGSHAICLQQLGLKITALEISAAACVVMKERGVKKVLKRNIFSYTQKKFDTLLLLMNGIGLCATINGLQLFLQHASLLLNNGGQIIADSSDIKYLYQQIPLPKNKYYGEISYCYEYKKNFTPWFNWLYADKRIFKKIALATGYTFKILQEDEYGQYLVKLTKK
jgi:2-polyprenyl-3-methyl-5-hydroxy-6-metoxy-1,4-benzoquinol methylase